jgi:hypothetical protein
VRPAASAGQKPIPLSNVRYTPLRWRFGAVT